MAEWYRQEPPHLGGYDITYNDINFTGKPNKTYKTHNINGSTPSVTELYTYAYDRHKAGRDPLQPQWRSVRKPGAQCYDDLDGL